MPPSWMDRDNPQPAIGDAFGEALLNKLGGESHFGVIYERDDGFIDADSGDYFLEPAGWPESDRWAIDRCRGRVLDLGAGAGRASLALQERGIDALAVDVSPGAIETCRRRGVRETFVGEVTELTTDPARKFDTFLALGNNLGLLGNTDRAARMLGAFTTLANPGATIVGTCLDPTFGEPPPWHASYHDCNRAAGLPPGQIRLRTRFRAIATEWFDLYWMSPGELDAVARKTGWQVTDVLPGLLYAAELTKTD